nr:DNA repair protein RadA isoform X2 [Aegilops tauschii subsp. strangulata]
MLRTTAAMLPSPASLRALLRLSRRAPFPRLRQLPSPPLLPRLRPLSSSPNPARDPLAPPEPLSSAFAAAASNPEAPADSDPDSSWGVFDPVAGRIVMQTHPPPPTSSSDREEEEEEEEEVVEVKPKARPSGGKREPRWADVATARRAAGKGGKAPRVSYVCSNCGDGFSQWWGTCRGCQAVGTLTKFFPGADSADADADAEGSHHAGRSWIRQKSKEMVPKKLREVTKGFDQAGWRIPLPGTFGNEISRVLGGGVVPGSLVLVGGDPGVGKSTLMLQLASIVSEGSEDHGSSPVVYVSGEESIEQIANRADRMSIKSKDLYLYSSTDIEDILDKIQPLSPKALVVDSIQTVYLSAFAGSAGNQVQVKECTSALLSFAKMTNIPVFLIGHVTKTGDIAGPRVLEHIVDVVLYMEGERCLSHRLLRSAKNRFGSTDEALSVPGSLGQGKVVGTKSKRVEMIISVLMKQAGLKLQDNVIYLNVVSGFELSETAGDLAIAASICSR